VTGVTNLTTQQNIDIWTGKDTNWNQVGGPDLPIVLIFRPASSGTRATFKKLVLGGATEATGGQTLTEDSNGAVTTAVTKTNGAVSVIGFAYYNDPANKPLLNGLQLDGVDATSPTWQRHLQARRRRPHVHQRPAHRSDRRLPRLHDGPGCPGNAHPEPPTPPSPSSPSPRSGPRGDERGPEHSCFSNDLSRQRRWLN
jgi:hypothetical protein